MTIPPYENYPVALERIMLQIEKMVRDEGLSLNNALLICKARLRLQGGEKSYNPLQAAKIVYYLEQGYDIGAILKFEDIHISSSTYGRWMRLNEEFRDMVQDALDVRSATDMDAIVPIADGALSDVDGEGEDGEPTKAVVTGALESAKLRISARVKRAEKRSSGLFGNKQTVKHEGNVGTQTINAPITITPIMHGYYLDSETGNFIPYEKDEVKQTPVIT